MSDMHPEHKALLDFNSRPAPRPGGNPEMGWDLPRIHWPWMLYAAAGVCAVTATVASTVAAALGVATAFLLVAAIIAGCIRLWSEAES